jgi:trans-aconitate methyltransferase
LEKSKTEEKAYKMQSSTHKKWDAELYDAKHAFVWEKAKSLVELLAPKLGERILDLGCGTGALTAEIAACGVETIGVDLSADMIDEARKKFPALRFEVMDARDLAFLGEFDAVFSNAVLHWIREPEQVIVGVEKALRPCGRFVAEFGGKRNIQRLVDGMERACKSMGISQSVTAANWYYPSIAEYASLLEMHGLEVRHAALFARPTKLEEGERGLDNWIHMFASAFSDSVGPQRLEVWIREVERQTRQELWKGEYWELDYRRLRIAAWKS